MNRLKHKLFWNENSSALQFSGFEIELK